MAPADLVEDITLDEHPPHFPGERTDLVCGDCGANMRLISASVRGPFYGCTQYPTCQGTHGAHKDGTPFGYPADSHTREVRKLAHETFDQLWKSGKMTRDEAYQWLASTLRLSKKLAHIGRFDAATCERVIQLAKRKLQESVITTIWCRLMGEDEF